MKNALPVVKLGALLCLLIGPAMDLSGQSWHPQESLPFYRGTAAQALYITNHSQSVACIANLKNLSLAAQHYASDHVRFPSAWSQFTTEISDPRYLYCPADFAHPAQTNWDAVNFTNVSYAIVAPGTSPSASPNTAFIQCLVHQNEALVDGRTKEKRVYEPSIPAAFEGQLYQNNPMLQVAKERAENIACLNNIKQIMLAARLYAEDNMGLWPTSFLQLTNELVEPRALFCPRDFGDVSPTSWTAENVARASYLIAKTNIPAGTIASFVRCQFHGNIGLSDGSALPGTNYPPLIQGHPLSQTVESGKTATLSVLPGNEAAGPFQYVWQRKQPVTDAGYPFTNTTLIAGATNRSYTITNASPKNEGYYDVFVFDNQGRYQKSGMAFLRVEPLDIINHTFSWETLTCLQNLKQIGLGANLYAHDHNEQFPTSFSSFLHYFGWPMTLYCPSDATREAPDHWNQVDAANLSYVLHTGLMAGATTNALASCKIHGFYVQADGDAFPAVNPPQIIAQPQTQVFLRGQTANLSVTASGSSLSYQWRKNGSPIPGATNSSWELLNAQYTDTGNYDVVLSNQFGSLTSLVATLTVTSPAGRLIASYGGVPSSNELVHLNFQGSLTTNSLVIEASTNLTTWAPIYTNQYPETTRPYADFLHPSRPARFYRLRIAEP